MKSTKNCQVIEEFFAPELLQEVLTHYDDVMAEGSPLRIAKDHIWRDDMHVGDYFKNTYFYHITQNMDDDVYGLIEKQMISKFDKVPKAMFYYLYTPGSTLQWHSDAEKGGACTIYLQEKVWRKEDGGLYLWEEHDGSIHGVRPRLNTAVYNEELMHCSTPTYDFSPIRKVLQVFFP